MTTRATDDRTVPSRQDTGFFGQPTVLANLFGVELWERFSFYGMQGILLIYLYFGAAGRPGHRPGHRDRHRRRVRRLGLPRHHPGCLARRPADRRRADAVLRAPSSSWSATSRCRCSRASPASGVGLVLIALGSGGVKANATSLVGSLYDEHDERRDAGFSLFYMGINIGALIGPLLTGLLQKDWGFHCGLRAGRGRDGPRARAVHARPAQAARVDPRRCRTRCRAIRWPLRAGAVGRRRGGRGALRGRRDHRGPALNIVIWVSVVAAVGSSC